MGLENGVPKRTPKVIYAMSSTLLAGNAEFFTLIEVAELARRVEDRPIGDQQVRILDCRASLADPQAGRRAYAAGHIPGAMFADLNGDLSGPIVPGSGRHPLPDRDRFVARLRAWGVDATSQIVAYDADSGAFAARLWWLARWLGHRRVAVLNGGYAAWCRAGEALSAAAPLPPRLTEFVPAPPLTKTVTVAGILAATQATLLIDARSAARFRGEEEPIDPVAGHIPGAHCLPFDGNLGPDGRFKSAAELALRFQSLGPRGREVTCYCGSGVTACHNLLAYSHAGLGEGALYAGSWSEWIADRSRPVARGSG